MPTSTFPRTGKVSSSADQSKVKTAGGRSHQLDEGVGQSVKVPGPANQLPDNQGQDPAVGVFDKQGTDANLLTAGGSPLWGMVGIGTGQTQSEVPSTVEDALSLNTVGGLDFWWMPGLGAGKTPIPPKSGVDDLVFYDVQTSAGFNILTYPWGNVTPGGHTPAIAAAVGSGHTVRVQFDRQMRNHPYLGGVLDPINYKVIEIDTSRVLEVFHVEWVTNYNEVRLYTEEFHLVYPWNYRVEVRNVQDADGDVLIYDYEDFSAAGTAFPAAEDMHVFYGLTAGLQASKQTAVTPDIDKPIVTNQDPAPLQTNVLVYSNIKLDIIDPSGSGINASSVIIRANYLDVFGVSTWYDVWKNDAAQPGYAVTKTPVTFGFRYDINPNTNMPDTARITIYVFAYDTASIPNFVETTYYFDTEIIDFDPPYLKTSELSPAPGSVDNAANAPIVVSVVDQKAGVDPATDRVKIWVNSILAWNGASPQLGFTGSRVATSPKGYKYTIIPDSDLPHNTIVLIDVHAYDLAGVPNFLDTSYTFHVEAIPSLLKAKQLVAVADDAIKLIFTGDVVTQAGGYNLALGYTIVDLDGIENPVVKSVYPISEKVANYVILEVMGMREKGRYQLTMDYYKIYDELGNPLKNVTVKWRMRRTKVDSALLGAAQRFDKRIGSNIRGILEAVMLSDEEIGGDY